MKKKRKKFGIRSDLESDPDPYQILTDPKHCFTCTNPSYYLPSLYNPNGPCTVRFLGSYSKERDIKFRSQTNQKKIERGWTFFRVLEACFNLTHAQHLVLLCGIIVTNLKFTL